MTWWAWFPLVFFFVLAHGYFARWVASHFVSEDKKDVAGFCFVLGMAYMVTGRVDEATDGAKLAASLGYLTGIAAIWYLFFKRETVTEQ